ncbi:MAG: hypothetical protein KIT84_03120 [Labilithrix sp.]|nr:hypothetical protein [Labilithrix sp.]MCW5809973.1 hypothetical protein [Labilithrix sp.]
MRPLALAAFAVLTVASCATRQLPPVVVLDKKVDPARPATYNGLALRSGQLVLTESPDSTSFVFPLLVKKYYPFTHVAILSVENGEPWVYDVTGEVKTFPIRSRIMDNVKGKMYRRPLFEYIAPNLYAEIFDPPPGADGDKIAAWARKKFEEGVEFDNYFDSKEHSKLFCSEMAMLAIADAGGPVIDVEASNPNASIVEGMKWLGVPPGEALPVYRFADPSRYVAALGQFTNRTQAYSYFEGKHEVHRRFTADQRMGFVFTLDSYGRIGVRPEISTFVARCAHMYDADPHPPEPFDPRIEKDCRKIADEMFGPFPDPTPLPSTPTPPTPPVATP